MSNREIWQRIGAWSGGAVSAVALSPHFATDGIGLAATSAGIFRTTDGGRRWQPGSIGIEDPVAVALAFAPPMQTDGATVFASTAQGRLYRSDDGGAGWQEIATWAGLGVITALALSPNYASDRTLFAATTDGMFRSQDDGATWESSTFGLLDSEILCIACAPDFAENETLWLGSALGGLYRSRNAARAWRESGMGLPDAAVQCLLVSPHFATDRTLFVGTEGFGVYQSTDGGANWEPTGAELATQSINSLCAVPGHDATLLAATEGGIYRSTDFGAHWEPVNARIDIPLSLAAAADGVVLAGTYADGIWRSEDGGMHWELAAENVVAHAPPLVHQSTEGALFALDMTGVLTASTDAGQTWQALDVDAAVDNFALVADGAHTQLIAVSEGALWLGAGTETAADSIPWTQRAAPVSEVALLAVSPTFHQDQSVLLGGIDGQLHLSTDAGESWRELTTPGSGAMPLQACFATAGGPVLYLVTAAENAQGNFAVDVWHLDLPLGEDSSSWENMAHFETEIPAVLIAAPPDPAERALFLSTQNRVIKLYTDADGELAVAQSFLEGDAPEEGEASATVRISALAASPGYVGDRTIFAGSNVGVHRSTDGGATWERYGDGLPALPVVALLPDRENELTAITLGGGVWRVSG